MTATTYKIFVGGPSDVASDIEIVIQALADANLVAASSGARFEPFLWSRDATPGISTEPQHLINQQASGYDALISVIGNKVGSPTKNYDSGTIEEIENAISVSSSQFFGQNSVLIFFKTIKIDTKSPDIEEALAVHKFRKTLGPRGILFKDFENEVELREAVLRCVGTLLSMHTQSGHEVVVMKEGKESDPLKQLDIPEIKIDEELGFLDYDELANSQMAEATSRFLLMGEAVSSLGNNIGKISENFGIANQAGDKDLIRKLVSDGAREMDQCASILEEHAPIAKELYISGYNMLRGALEIQSSDFNKDKFRETVDEIWDKSSGVSSVLLSTKNTTITFYHAISGLPRVSKYMNAAKVRLLRAVELVVSMYEDVIAKNEELLAYVNSFRN